MTKSHKKQHYVPVVYLKSWCDKGNNINSIDLKTNVIRITNPRKLCQKSNLYTLSPEELERVGFDYPLLHELFTFGLWEQRWNNVLAVIQDRKPLLNQVKIDFIGFVIAQSFRTPKFKKDNEAIFNLNRQKHKTEFNFAGIAILEFSKYYKNATFQIEIATGPTNLITSDNPATHWLEMGAEIQYQPQVFLNPEFIRNKSYCIIFPINPRCIVRLYPNIDLPNVSELMQYTFISDDTVKLYNKLIELGANKVLMFKNPKDLIRNIY